VHNHNKEMGNEKYKASDSCMKKMFGDLVVNSPKKDVIILRGENSSLSIFVGKYNNKSILKKWIDDNNINLNADDDCVFNTDNPQTT